MDFFTAKQKADEYIHDKYRDEVIIVSINVKTYGWIFSYQSKEFVETGHFLDMLSGNNPFLITKEGQLHEIVMYKYAGSYEEKIKKFEEEHGLIDEFDKYL